MLQYVLLWGALQRNNETLEGPTHPIQIPQITYLYRTLVLYLSRESRSLIQTTPCDPLSTSSSPLPSLDQRPRTRQRSRGGIVRSLHSSSRRRCRRRRRRRQGRRRPFPPGGNRSSLVAMAPSRPSPRSSSTARGANTTTYGHRRRGRRR